MAEGWHRWRYKSRRIQLGWLVGVGAIAVVGVVAATLGPYALVDDAISHGPTPTPSASPSVVSASDYLAGVAAARTAILLGAGGLIALLTLYFTRLRDAVAERVRDDDRFVEAAKLLADESAAVRLIGIHALKQLADDDGVDRKMVGDILVGFVREKAPTITEDQKSREPVRPGVDVDGALRAIARLTAGGAPVRVWVRDRMLAYAPLSKAVLTNANLHNANLTEAYLNEVDFTQANIEGTVFTGADLRGANLSAVRGTIAEDQFDRIHIWDDRTRFPNERFAQRPAVLARKETV